MKFRAKNLYSILVGIIVINFILLPAHTISVNPQCDNEGTLTPYLPHTQWGQCYDESGSDLPSGGYVSAWIDGVQYDLTNIYVVGWYDITIWDDYPTPEIKEGGEGWPGHYVDSIQFVYSLDPIALTTDGHFFRETPLYDSQYWGYLPDNLNLVDTTPPLLKISAICTDSSSSVTQWIRIYNPTEQSIDLNSFSIAVGTDDPVQITETDISSGNNPLPMDEEAMIRMDIKWPLNTNGNAIRLIGSSSGFVVDRVEYGDIPTAPENTILTNAVAPPTGSEISRSPTIGSDTNDCENDFVIREELNTVFSLDVGWNLISIPLPKSNPTIQNVLWSIEGKYDILQYYDTIDSGNHWKTYSKFYPPALNDFWEIHTDMGFWIHMTEPADLIVTGYRTSSTDITLRTGWNLIGYPTLTEMTVSNALLGTGIDKVEAFDPASPYSIKEVGPTYMMKPGEGYWVHVPVDTVWVVDW